MVATIDTACSDSDDDSDRQAVAAAAKRNSAVEGSSPAYKARRRSQDKHAIRHLRTSPKITDGKIIDKVELLEPSDTLEQRLRFVSPAGESNGSNSEAYLSTLVRQMKNMCIAPVQECEASKQDVEQHQQDSSVSSQSEADVADASDKPRGRGGPWRICVEPGSEKAIHTTEEDGWQIIDEYGEKTPPRHSPSTSPERTGVTASAQTLAPSKSNPVLSRSDSVDHFQWLVENLPYPASMYSVTVDDSKQQIVIKTSNRKYYKRIDLPDLGEHGLQLNAQALTWKHSQDTLTVSYTKPAACRVSTP